MPFSPSTTNDMHSRKSFNSRLITNKAVALGLLLNLVAMRLNAQSGKPFLTTQESDPANMGWMQGFPPPKSKVLSAVDGSFFNFPALRWSVVRNVLLHARSIGRFALPWFYVLL